MQTAQGLAASLQARRERYKSVIQLKQTARRAALVVAVLGVAGASAAMWNQYAPSSVCLYCVTPEHYETALNAVPRATVAAGVNSHRASDLGLPSKPTAIPQPSPEPLSSHSESSGSVQADAPRAWQPWDDDKTTEPGRFNPASAGPLWFTMVELRRSMMMGHYAEPSGGMATAAPRPSHGADAPNRPAAESSPASEPQPAPPASGTSGPNPGNSGSNPPPNQGPGSSPTPGPTATPPSAPPAAPGPSGSIPSDEPPTNPFVEHTTPPADPFVPPRPVGSLDPAGPGGTVTPPGAGPAATPEPASFLLIGTGLMILLTDLRRRRVI